MRNNVCNFYSLHSYNKVLKMVISILVLQEWMSQIALTCLTLCILTESVASLLIQNLNTVTCNDKVLRIAKIIFILVFFIELTIFQLFVVFLFLRFFFVLVWYRRPLRAIVLISASVLVSCFTANLSLILSSRTGQMVQENILNKRSLLSCNKWLYLESVILLIFCWRVASSQQPAMFKLIVSVEHLLHKQACCSYHFTNFKIYFLTPKNRSMLFNVANVYRFYFCLLSFYVFVICIHSIYLVSSVYIIEFCLLLQSAESHSTIIRWCRVLCHVLLRRVLTQRFILHLIFYLRFTFSLGNLREISNG